MKVLLIGVSCVGKSTIGAKLAVLLGIPFFDLDTEVEAFFQTSIGLLQAQCRSMHAYRTKACRVLKALLSRTDAQDCVIALPPSGLQVPYWNVVKGSRATLVVVQDDPINILNRIVFFDNDARPSHKELTAAEHQHYLDEIKQDMTYFRRSYAKADVTVHIEGLGPGEAAKKIKLALGFTSQAEWRGRPNTRLTGPVKHPHRTGQADQTGQAASIGIDRGNEVPGATWQVQARPHNRNWRRGLSLAKGIFLPQASHLAQAKVPGQSSFRPAAWGVGPDTSGEGDAGSQHRFPGTRK